MKIIIGLLILMSPIGWIFAIYSLVAFVAITMFTGSMPTTVIRPKWFMEWVK